ncbi:uncharacterized protein C9orf40 homolog [Synchiropus splendidus]|uniref:uncharacterized protein C9orf40 homolog n=1 Tax=Synchiropus splendidus TaxID=270530 RepID=UPI00237DFA6B|nr:uncharacterized protein C9orf40 homolog [Synchiropus splendidus]
MAKRRAGESLLDHSPTKRWRRVCGVDVQLESVAPLEALDPPSLLVLMGGRRRKRPHYFVEPEQPDEPWKHPRATHLPSAGEPQSDAFSSAHFQTQAPANSKKRPREESVCAKEGARPEEPADADYVPEDYNSFQYWRTPLPELDLSLLEDTTEKTGANQETKYNPPSTDAVKAT